MEELRFERTDATNQDFIALVKQLDAFLAITDGDDHAFYDQYNKLGSIKHVVLLYENDIVVSCGAIKEYDRTSMEVKRMFTVEQSRGKGYASKVLVELESWAKELSYSKCILETGIRQTSAITLYQNNNYSIIPNYGQYKEVKDSRCFQKILD